MGNKRKTKYRHERSLSDTIKDKMAGGMSYPTDADEDRRAYDNRDTDAGINDDDTRSSIRRHKAKVDKKARQDSREKEAREREYQRKRKDSDIY